MDHEQALREAAEHYVAARERWMAFAEVASANEDRPAWFDAPEARAEDDAYRALRRALGRDAGEGA